MTANKGKLLGGQSEDLALDQVLWKKVVYNVREELEIVRLESLNRGKICEGDLKLIHLQL